MIFRDSLYIFCAFQDWTKSLVVSLTAIHEGFASQDIILYGEQDHLFYAQLFNHMMYFF